MEPIKCIVIALMSIKILILEQGYFEDMQGMWVTDAALRASAYSLCNILVVF